MLVLVDIQITNKVLSDYITNETTYDMLIFFLVFKAIKIIVRNKM